MRKLPWADLVQNSSSYQHKLRSVPWADLVPAPTSDTRTPTRATRTPTRADDDGPIVVQGPLGPKRFQTRADADAWFRRATGIGAGILTHTAGEVWTR